MNAENVYVDLPQRRLTGRTTAEQVADVLRDDIIAGVLPPGRPLPEEHVAGSFSVSRRSAREALRILENDGLVRHQRHRGSTVTEFSPDDLQDLYAARAVIEPAAAECSSDPAIRESAAFAALSDSLAALREATNAEDARGIVTADVRFHSALVGLLNSPRIDRLFASIATEMLFAIALLEKYEKQTSTHRPQESLAEHQAIFDAISAGEGASAREQIVRHLTSSRDGLASAWAARRNSSD